MLIGKLAEATGVSRDTIRFYERKGMIKGHISPGTTNSYRQYDEQIVDRIRVIKQAQHFGFTLTEIAKLIDEFGSGRMPKKKQIWVMEEKIAMVQAKLDELTKTRDYLIEKLSFIRTS
jgi:MerR family transcriptional regulator, copper efflux regulator